MDTKTLCVRARGTALVQNIEALTANPRSFIGRNWVVVDGQYGSEASGETVEVANRAEYRRAVVEGALWAADEETAKACGVAFDPSFDTPVASVTVEKKASV